MAGPASFLIVSQYTYDGIVVPCCVNSTMSAPFLSQKIVAVSFLQADVCLNFSAEFLHADADGAYCYQCALND
jgi:hypothetical protein